MKKYFLNRSGISFDSGVKIYRALKVMTVIKGDFARDVVGPRMHHIFAVVWATIALYFLMTQVIVTANVSIFVVLLCATMIFISGWVEWFAIGLVAMGATLSKTFIREMARIHGRKKIRRRVMGSLLPNFINLEFVTSVKTMQEGIEMGYFANFMERVTNNTINLLLARSV